MIDGQDWMHAARALKDTSPNAFVILMTGNGSIREVDGLDRILLKPFDFEEFRSLLPIKP